MEKKEKLMKVTLTNIGKVGVSAEIEMKGYSNGDKILFFNGCYQALDSAVKKLIDGLKDVLEPGELLELFNIIKGVDVCDKTVN